MLRSIYIGFDPRPAEAVAFAVTRHSVQRRLTQKIPVQGLVLSDLIERGLYTRPMERRPAAADKPVMWDVISDAPMSTEFANSRFLVPTLQRLASRVSFQAINDRTPRYLNGTAGWALFMDGDMLARTNIARVTDGLDLKKAVYCVKHNHVPTSTVKMDGQTQTQYSRKNWSSFVLFNCDHPSNRDLTPDVVNMLPGRDLHRFCWLKDDEIGELGPEWNWLVGHSDPSIDPKVAHFTDGPPNIVGYESAPFADEWRAELARWAA